MSQTQTTDGSLVIKDPALVAKVLAMMEKDRTAILGDCVACGQPVSTHFDKDNRFMACKAGAGKVFKLIVEDLVQTTRAAKADGAKLPVKNNVAQIHQHRGFRRAVYAPTRSGRVNIDGLELAPVRAQVLKVLQASDVPLLAKQIMNRAELPHGSVQQTLNWLRGQNLVKATAANSNDPHVRRVLGQLNAKGKTKRRKHAA